jgi:hypothetical protein
MTRVLVSCAVISLVCACENREDPGKASTIAEAAEPSAQDAEPGEPMPAPELAEEPQPSPVPDEPSEATQERSEDVANPPRDLAGELQAAVGSPVDCLQDYQPSAATVIRVGISALVRPSGLVIEPSASGNGLSSNDLRCIEERVGDVVLPPLDAQASQPVSTYVELNYQRPAVKEYDVGEPTPKLNDVVEALPKKKTIRPSGVPIDKAPSDAIDGPKGVPIEGPRGVPIQGPKPKPIDGY